MNGSVAHTRAGSSRSRRPYGSGRPRPAAGEHRSCSPVRYRQSTRGATTIRCAPLPCASAACRELPGWRHGVVLRQTRLNPTTPGPMCGQECRGSLARSCPPSRLPRTHTRTHAAPCGRRPWGSAGAPRPRLGAVPPSPPVERLRVRKQHDHHHQQRQQRQQQRALVVCRSCFSRRRCAAHGRMAALDGSACIMWCAPENAACAPVRSQNRSADAPYPNTSTPSTQSFAFV